MSPRAVAQLIRVEAALGEGVCLVVKDAQGLEFDVPADHTKTRKLIEALQTALAMDTDIAALVSSSTLH